MEEYGIIGMIISSLCTGGLTWVFTLKFSRKQAEADAMKSVQDVYQELIDDLRGEKKEVQDENRELRDEIKRLTDRIDTLESSCSENAKRIEDMQPYLCYKKNCANRVCLDVHRNKNN